MEASVLSSGGFSYLQLFVLTHFAVVVLIRNEVDALDFKLNGLTQF